MRSRIVRMVGIAALVCSGVSNTQACTNLSATAVDHAPATTSVFVPTIVSSSVAIPVAAPVATQVTGFGVVAVPQTAIAPQTVTVQSLLVPQLLQPQIVRQRVRVNAVPRLGFRSLICR